MLYLIPTRVLKWWLELKYELKNSLLQLDDMVFSSVMHEIFIFSLKNGDVTFCIRGNTGPERNLTTKTTKLFVFACYLGTASLPV